MFCGGTLVVDVRVICYSRVRERTSHSGPSYIAGRGEGSAHSVLRSKGAALLIKQNPSNHILVRTCIMI